MILRGVNFEKLEHLGEISTKIKTILTHYSVAQAGSNYEKNRSKISLDCPFKYDTEKSNDSVQYDELDSAQYDTKPKTKRNQKLF